MRIPLSIEKDGAVLYSDFVTILRLASLQYITKLAMSQSQKPRYPLPLNYKVMYLDVCSIVRTKYLHGMVVNKIFLQQGTNSVFLALLEDALNAVVPH